MGRLGCLINGFVQNYIAILTTVLISSYCDKQYSVLICLNVLFSLILRDAQLYEHSQL